MDFVEPARRLPLNREADALASAAGDRPRALRARSRLVIDHYEAGEPTRGDAALARYDEIAALVGQPRFAWRGRGLHALRAMFEGRFADAEMLAEEAAALARAARDPAAEFPLTFQRLALAIQREREGDLEALESAVAAIARGTPAELG